MTGEKLRHVVDRTVVCRTCNLDPVNQLTQQLSAEAAGESDPAATAAMVERLRTTSRAVIETVEEISPGARAQLERRRFIPVRAR